MTADTPLSKTIGMLVQKAKIAQLDFEKYNQEQVNEVITAVAWAICNPLNNKLIAELSVSSTNLGKKEDKIIKNRRKTLGLLRDLQQAKSVGVIQEDKTKGISAAINQQRDLLMLLENEFQEVLTF